MGQYGLGNVRTLHDYEVYGGFDFKKCLIQDYTLKVKDAPNPTDWETQFIKTKFDLVCDWDLEFFKVLDFKKVFSNLEPEGKGRGIIMGVTCLLDPDLMPTSPSAILHGRYGILIFSCLLFVLFEKKMCSSKSSFFKSRNPD